MVGSSASKTTAIKCRYCIVAFLLFVYSGASCSSDYVDTGFRFSETQRQTADKIISVFENNTPELQYGYVEELGDGRGITAGRAGFTSATGDMYIVVSDYTRQVPGNSLQAFLPSLKSLAQNESSDTVGLAGLSSAWIGASGDALFRAVQDRVVDTLYYNQAVEYGAKAGATQALSLLILYDTIIQHGGGMDPDGLPALINQTNAVLQGSNYSEQEWNTEFLKQRRRVLNYASSPGTRAVWAQSVGRVDTLQSLVDEGNVHLEGSIAISTWGTAFILE